MELKKVFISELSPAAYNPRKDLQPEDPEYQKIKSSMEKSGLVDPIIIRTSDRLVIGGHQRLKVLKERGITVLHLLELGGISWAFSEEDLPEPSDSEAKSLNIQLNKIVGAWDMEKLAVVLDDLRSEDFDLSLTGFSQKEIDDLLKGDLPPAEYPPGLIGPVFSDGEIVDEAFRYFRDYGFPYPRMAKFEAMQEINALSKSGRAGGIASGHKIADTYMPHRFAANASNMRSPLDAFEDDAALHKLLGITLDLEKEIRYRFPSFWGYSQGIQIVRNFAPSIALHLYRRFCPKGGTVLDTSLGYGGRLIAYIASNIQGRYIGIDPNLESCREAEQIVQDLGYNSGEIIIINSPVEDIDLDRFRGECDLHFTSPPYFSKEIYSDDPSQSCVRYPGASEWRKKFLRRMLEFQYASLKDDGVNIINIADVKIGNKNYPLVKWTKEEANDIGFHLVKEESFRRPIAPTISEAEHDPSEPILIFEKGG